MLAYVWRSQQKAYALVSRDVPALYHLLIGPGRAAYLLKANQGWCVVLLRTSRRAPDTYNVAVNRKVRLAGVRLGVALKRHAVGYGASGEDEASLALSNKPTERPRRNLLMRAGLSPVSIG